MGAGEINEDDGPLHGALGAVDCVGGASQLHLRSVDVTELQVAQSLEPVEACLVEHRLPWIIGGIAGKVQARQFQGA